MYDLPNGFMSEAVGRQLGNFFGDFISYDAKNNSSIWREFMRIKIRLDVRKPLKRKKKIKRKNGSEFTVLSKYERLGDFCFACGLVTHTERFCRKSLDSRSDNGVRDWGAWLRAPARRGGNQGGSKWLREEDDVDWPAKGGRECNYPDVTGDNTGKQIVCLSDKRDNRRDGGDFSKLKPRNLANNGPGSSSKLVLIDGLEDEEVDGLELGNRKRSRLGPESKITMDTDEVLPSGTITKAGKVDSQNETAISETDLAASYGNVLATLAVQASRPL